MRAVYLMFDTLNRRHLECYGGTTVKTPNFNRLAERSVSFDNHYVGSLPCMPARREMHSGRYNFLHRSWGPLEPFDNSFVRMLGEQTDTYTHLVTDHAHYWEDGGLTYHPRYDSYELVRGQAADQWKGVVEPPAKRWEEKYHPSQFNMERRHKNRLDMLNRDQATSYDQFPAVKTMTAGLEFLETNKGADNWFLHIETFDPHEPFIAPDHVKELYATEYEGRILDFPNYGPVRETPEEVREINANYEATLAHCDIQLGRILDFFDEHDLWKDTALIVSTDHGFLLGEHELWGKLIMPFYNEIAHIPLMIHHPDHASQAGERRSTLTQTIDLMPTILDMFGIEKPKEVQGHSLLPVLAEDPGLHGLREAGLFGQHGSSINVTDGRYVYLRYPPDMKAPTLYQYTIMPTHIKSMFSVEELQDATLAPPFNFTKGVPVLKVPSTEKSPVYHRHGIGVQILCKTQLFDLEKDPYQLKAIDDPEIEGRMRRLMVDLMLDTDAPQELYDRFDLRETLEKVRSAQAAPDLA